MELWEEGDNMFYLVDTKENKTIGMYEIKCNADRRCQALNIRNEGLDEVDKPEADRRFVVRG